MKPNFALNFTDDSITLLHRTKRGWAEVGRTSFAVDDLPAELAKLRAKAEELAPDGITTKLVIPNSQIKYLEIAAPGPDAAKRRAQIAAALEGQTPYDVADLVWDHWGKGPTVQVAVLARETLDEAEGFALANGFNPVSFVAIPDDVAYAGEPFFGPSAHAATVLKPGEKVDRDQDPIRLADPKPAPAAPDAEPEPEAEPDPAPQPETTPLPDTEPVQVPPPQPEIVPEPLPAETPDPGNDPQPTPEPEGIPQPDPTPPDPVETPQDAPAYDPIPEPLTADLDVASGPELSLSDYDPASIAATLSADDPPEPPPEPEPAQPLTVASVLDTAIADLDEAPMAVDVEEPEPVRKGPSVIDPSVEDDLPPMPSGAVLTALNGRGKADTTTAPRPAPIRPAPAPTADRPAPKAERPAPRPPKFGYESPGDRPAPPAGKGLRSLGALVTAPSIPGGRKARAAAAATTAATTAAAQAATAATTATAKRPSGLGTRPMPVRGKPRHLGLILTGLLLIMLALAAGLSSFYISRSDATSDVETAAADLPAPEDEMAADGILPEDEMLADGILPEEVAPDVTAPEAVVPEDVATETAAPEAAPAADDATAASDATVPATDAPATGVVMQAQDPNAAPEPAPRNVAGGAPEAAPAPGTDPQDEIFLASSDTAPRMVDPAALPPPVARADAQPQPPPPPPPPGTVYQFDENGLVRATPEGIVSPEGVLLTAGRPARVPPPRPERFAELAEATAPTAEPTEEVIIPSDPALANARPLPRPATLAPAPAATPEDDGAALAPLADPRLAGIRPAARPADAAATAVAQGIVAPVAAAGNGSLALVAPEGTVTPVGLAISRRPAARPQDMARAIEEAVAAVARLPEPAIPDEVAPEAEPEPEVASAAPRIPSTANVAKQATVRNAINLREVNLIGVYGTPSERYALVRNPNGRYIKVGVGDRLDGGRVAAITSSELRYEKRGRMVVLSLPNS